jgi:two-component system cell cycle sensor histidine kinase/response regulator CckA
LATISAGETLPELTHEIASAPPKRLRLLIADDNPEDVDIYLRYLEKSGFDFEAESVLTREEFVKKLREDRFDVVLSDYRMNGWNGMDALAAVKETCPDVPLILLSGTLGDELAAECIKLGVTDYVLKDHLARLPMALRRAQEEKTMRDAGTRGLAALQESEQHYRTLVENAPEAIVVLDVDKGTFVDCNHIALRLFGVTREEHLRRGPADLSPRSQPDGRPSVQAAREYVEAALAGGTPRFEWVHRNSNGDDIACEVHLVQLPSSTRRLVRGSIIDITERKRGEAALRESEARYRGLVNNATYGIYWVTIGGDLLHVNPAMIHMLGCESEKELLEIRNTEALYCDPAARKKVHDEYARTGNVDAVVEWRRKDGKVITVRLNGRRVLNPERDDECVEVIAEEITERLALEKQLVQAQKFEAIGQLAGGIAHDFNNMIGAILGWADMGIEETEAGSRVHRHFEKMRQQADRAAALTRQLLTFARRQILEPCDIDLNQSVIETLSLMEKVIGSDVEIKANLASDLAIVRADPIQIDQVLMNLCINARDSMPEGGSLVVETSNVSIDESFCALQPLARPGDHALLSVTDTGVGMDAATLDRIFEPFFTTKEPGKGTGLGLATVYGIVRQHGGFLHVYSEPGTGSTFRVYLPVSTTAEASPAKREEPQPLRGGHETVLFAEDHEGLGQLAVETLTNLGYEVILVKDGAQAIEEFRSHRHRIDLAVLDVILPKHNGPEIYARIHAEEPNMPVIFATGYSPDIALIYKVQQEHLPMLQKPYSPDDLGRKVRETLDQHARVTPHD